MLYTIGEMAKLLNLPPSTLRFYDKQGILPFIERSKGGIRMFKESDYELLKVIECLKKTGMSLKDIRDYIRMTMQGDATITDRLRLFRKRREEVQRQIVELEQALEIVNFKCWYYEKAQQTGTTDDVQSLDLEEIPEQFREIRKNLCTSGNDEGE